MLVCCVARFFFLARVFVVVQARKEVTLSNVDLPKDTVGNLLLTGEAFRAKHKRKVYTSMTGFLPRS